MDASKLCVCGVFGFSAKYRLPPFIFKIKITGDQKLQRHVGEACCASYSKITKAYIHCLKFAGWCTSAFFSCGTEFHIVDFPSDQVIARGFPVHSPKLSHHSITIFGRYWNILRHSNFRHSIHQELRQHIENVIGDSDQEELRRSVLNLTARL